jgi:hypothetical protein
MAKLLIPFSEMTEFDRQISVLRSLLQNESGTGSLDDSPYPVTMAESSSKSFNVDMMLAIGLVEEVGISGDYRQVKITEMGREFSQKYCPAFDLNPPPVSGMTDEDHGVALLRSLIGHPVTALGVDIDSLQLGALDTGLSAFEPTGIGRYQIYRLASLGHVEIVVATRLTGGLMLVRVTDSGRIRARQHRLALDGEEPSEAFNAVMDGLKDALAISKGEETGAIVHDATRPEEA